MSTYFSWFSRTAPTQPTVDQETAPTQPTVDQETAPTQHITSSSTQPTVEPVQKQLKDLCLEVDDLQALCRREFENVKAMIAKTKEPKPQVEKETEPATDEALFILKCCFTLIEKQSQAIKMLLEPQWSGRTMSLLPNIETLNIQIHMLLNAWKTTENLQSIRGVLRSIESGESFCVEDESGMNELVTPTPLAQLKFSENTSSQVNDPVKLINSAYERTLERIQVAPRDPKVAFDIVKEQCPDTITDDQINDALKAANGEVVSAVMNLTINN